MAYPECPPDIDECHEARVVVEVDMKGGLEKRFSIRHGIVHVGCLGHRLLSW
jgi:hypothetical protein